MSLGLRAGLQDIQMGLPKKGPFFFRVLKTRITGVLAVYLEPPAYRSPKTS